MIAASEARAEARLERMLAEVRLGFAEVRGEMGAAEAKIAALPTTWALVGTVFAAALTAVALVIAALAFGNDMLARGFTAQDIARAAAAEALAVQRSVDASDAASPDAKVDESKSN